jgi:hypothetical protein
MADRDKKALHFARVKIAGGPEIGETQMLAFEWKSFVNGGYIVRCKVSDPNLSLLRDKVIKQYLQKAREAPTEIEFAIGYVGGDETETRKESITDLDLYGDSPHGGFEFVAIDPPNWFLNGGLGDGKVYEGSVSDVIEKCVKEYAPDIKVEVTKTEDNPKGCWAMMRQDPKTFIQSLLDWSASLTPKKTNWMVASVDKKIIIKEQHDFFQNRRHFGNYNNSMGLDKTNDIVDYAVLNNSFVSVYQNALVTQGLSAVSGKFLDVQTSKDKTEIRDENTENKANTRTDAEKAFKKPSCKWSTSIMAVPELAGGEMGIKYEEWIGGRARNLFISMLPMVMRVRLTIHGDPEYHDSSKLGVSTLNINWKDFDKQDFFLAGRWLVYGFHHRMTKIKKPRWFTDVYIYRIDHDADSKKA